MTHSSGASRRGNAELCLTISVVVPAKAGTHTPRRLLGEMLFAGSPQQRRPVVMVPAFAGTTAMWLFDI